MLHRFHKSDQIFKNSPVYFISQGQHIYQYNHERVPTTPPSFLSLPIPSRDPNAMLNLRTMEPRKPRSIIPFPPMLSFTRASKPQKTPACLPANQTPQ